MINPPENYKTHKSYERFKVLKGEEVEKLKV
jgi:hypothetical protein